MTRSADVLKLALLVFFAALLQVTVVAPLDVAGGSADLLLVAVAALALLRGSVTGATAGFFGGLIADTATLQTLGVTSLLLTVAGYWVGRYAETRGGERAHAPLVAVFVVTVAYAVGAFALHFMLGYEVSAQLALVQALPPAILLNLLLAPPVYGLCRRLLRFEPGGERAREVRLLG